MLARIITAAGLCLSIAMLAAPANGEDTDIFDGNPAITGGSPNVLIVLANQASWNSQFDYEKQALTEVFNGLTQGFKVGLMMFSQSQNQYCDSSGNSGGFVRFAVRQMTGTNKTALSTIVQNLDRTGDSGNNATYGLTMYEAYNYFGGRTAWSGAVCKKRDYPGNPNNPEASGLDGHAFASAAAPAYTSPMTPDNACAKNYIIFISNGPATDSNTGQASTAAGQNLALSNGDNTLIPIFPSAAQDNKGDEWARFLYKSDVNAALGGTQNVITYTVDVNPGSQNQDLAHTALLKSMAAQGKGRYFAASDLESLKRAMNDIFNEIQAISSVFASVTLPVTVGVRGSFLNQVYMGVFRPDPDAAPRWLGNVKEYEIAFDTASKVGVLTDRVGASQQPPVPLVGGAGLARPDAVSFWTDVSNFWSFSPSGDPPSASDLPDGAIVEKGGAAQRLRAVLATSQTGRTLYTCTGTCASTLASPAAGGITPSSFATTNTDSDFSAADFGIRGPFSLTSLSRSGTTVSATTASAHGFSTGDIVKVAGAAPAQYNGFYSGTVTGTNSLTYQISVTPVSPDANATPSGSTVNVSKLTALPAISTLQAGNGANSTLVTATLSAVHGISVGSAFRVAISGASVSQFNGIFTATVVSPTAFSYTVTPDPGNGRTATGASAFVPGTAIAVIALVRDNPTTDTTATATATTASSHSLLAGDRVAVQGAAGTEFNGLFPVLSAGAADRFSYTVNTGPNSPANTATATVQTGSTDRNTLINWVRGEDNFEDENINGCPSISGSATNNCALNPTTVRASIHGDVVHSRPAVINYGRTAPTDPTNPSTQRDIMVYYGANDGVLHAVKGGRDLTDGNEKWGVVFPEFFRRLDRLRSRVPSISSATPKPYFADGPIGVYIKDGDINGRLGDAADTVRLYPTMHRGGRFLYGLDVNDPDSPKILWRNSNATSGFAELGQTWSEPRTGVVRVSGADVQVVIFGAGYDPSFDDATSFTSSAAGSRSMGRAVFVVDGATGALIKSFDATNTAGMDASVPADVRTVDRDGDGRIDRLYAADTAGNVWRFDLGDDNPAHWSGRKLAALAGTDPADRRKFLFGPDVVLGTDFDAVLIGSGDREHPFEGTPNQVVDPVDGDITLEPTGINDFFYMLRDDGTPGTITPNDLATVVGDDPVILTGKKGWKLPLNSASGEKVVGGSTTVLGTTFFVTNSPPVYTTGDAAQCKSKLGDARIYAVNFLTAAAMNFTDAEGNKERSMLVEEGGLLPTPVAVQVRTDTGQIVTGVLPGPHFVPGSGAGRRSTVFWYREID